MSIKCLMSQLVRAQSDTKRYDTLIPCEAGKSEDQTVSGVGVGSSPSGTSIFLPSLYPFIRLLALVTLVGCGSVQTINGVRIPKNRPNLKNYCLVGVSCFAFGYYLGSEVLPQKRN